MVPFCSRIRDGRFDFQGREVRLPANHPPEPHPIHGDGWQREWTVLRHEPAAAVLGYEHVPAAWPWAYAAQLQLRLEGPALAMRLSITNRAPRPMPLGFGWHLYFPLTPRAELRADVSHRWELDAALLGVVKRPLEQGDPPLARGVRVAAGTWDAVFAGWDQRFEIAWPEWQARLLASATGPLGHLVLYAPAGTPWFCAEPVSNVPDAFNLRARGAVEHGALVLEPGRTVSGEVRLHPGGWDSR